jgi:hypothetical protein
MSSYNPIPTRVWSRVQNPCTYTDASGNSDINYNQVYIPLTNQTVSPAQANYEDKLIYKGNILQYKGNSSRLTKSQKYTQLAKGFGPNRTKVFATQSVTYTNPNTSGLQRVNYSTIPFPNPIVGAPNNISGPYQYNVPNPNGCSGVSIQDGGTLVCGTFANPCNGKIIKQSVRSATICNPASASDVPGPSTLCWNNNVETWFPKPRYVMNNSTDKWPVNYKGLVSATKPSYNVTIPVNATITKYINNGYTGLVFDVNATYSSLVPPTTGSCTLKFCTNVNVNILIVGGGGGGAAGDNGTSATAGGGGGGGGAITYITNFTLPGITNIQINIGGGGWGRTPGNGGFGNEAGQGGANSLLSYSSSSFISGGGGGGIGDGTTVGYGGGLGGDSSGIAGGYGGGGGGGAYQFGGGSINNGGSGGSGQPSGTNPGTNGSNAAGTSGGNGGSSALTTVTLPFTPVQTVLYLGGGGGGGGSQSGGLAGNGSGGTSGTNSGTNYGGANALSGISNTSYGGGGGGGGINSDSALDIGGNGGNGTVIIWWQSI